MFKISKFVYNMTTRFHLFIVSFFLLIFLNACGYKDSPYYEIKDANGSVIDVKKFQSLENEI
ncbi:hypothetical protein FPD46_03720 [Campylobacter peloridis]|uniref:Uncharacterized protein n=2 Tax=Campylobacter peloridis TaxID=488546 RepID=A0A5C7DWH0_9BACT|nr:hypothetical protein [Campylobacter peloridis]AJC84445.1 hypothetical protein CPEL_0601 [Campylobacter peloridis LMG 23910]TXE82970.1 hypothetical protein FPD46_03720 [Campylobacter peloridis]